MTPEPVHRCKVIGAPWPGVHATWIESGRHYGRHAHDTFGIGVIEHGAQRSASGRGEVEAYAGEVITTNPGEVHDGRPHGGTTRRWRIVYFEPAALANALDLPTATLALTQPVYRDARVRQALDAVLAGLDRWSRGAPRTRAELLACDEALVALGGCLRGRMVDPPVAAGAADLRAVRDRLLEELRDPPSLAELAAMCGTSRFQLMRRFTRAHGLPPYRWLIMQRAEVARRAIRGGAELAEAALVAGFADQSHLTRTFVRCFGFTPGALRRAVAPRRSR